MPQRGLSLWWRILVHSFILGKVSHFCGKSKGCSSCFPIRGVVIFGGDSDFLGKKLLKKNKNYTYTTPEVEKMLHLIISCPGKLEDVRTSKPVSGFHVKTLRE